MAPSLEQLRAARRQLLLRAMHAFGPVTEADLAWWLPAPKGEVSRALGDRPPAARPMMSRVVGRLSQPGRKVRWNAGRAASRAM